MRIAAQSTKTKDQRPKTTAKALLLVSNCLLLIFLCLLPSPARAQQVVDRMVATVDSGGRVDLITYSDLLWQVAMQPDSPLEHPSSAELNRVLNLLINQHLIIQEAEKLPTIAPTDEEVRAAIDNLVRRFPSAADFERRLRSVGFSSKDDEQFRRIIEQRVEIEKYLDFRFRSFVVITPQEVADYYRDVYVPGIRKNTPGRILPNLEEVRAELERTLTEEKIAADTDDFIESARERAEITILNPV
jgi:hypothetical protein